MNQYEFSFVTLAEQARQFAMEVPNSRSKAMAETPIGRADKTISLLVEIEPTTNSVKRKLAVHSVQPLR